MAKARPLMSFVQMESHLGYKIDISNYPNDTTKRFYSSLRPEPQSVYERAVEDIDANTFKIPRAHGESAVNVPAIGAVSVCRPALSLV